MDAAELIKQECDDLCALLLDKNRRYGNSALEPIRVFSRAGVLEQLNVRMDDKLSRIVSGQEDDDEDAERDLAGYLILKSIARKLAAAGKDAAPVARAVNSYLERLRALRHGREGSSDYAAPPFPVESDDDPMVVHLVPERSSRSTLPDECLGALCGRPQGGCRG